MTTYKRITKDEIIDLISRTQDEGSQETFSAVTARRYINCTAYGKMLKKFRKLSGLDLLHTEGDLFLIRHTNGYAMIDALHF